MSLSAVFRVSTSGFTFIEENVTAVLLSRTVWSVCNKTLREFLTSLMLL